MESRNMVDFLTDQLSQAKGTLRNERLKNRKSRDDMQARHEVELKRETNFVAQLKMQLIEQRHLAESKVQELTVQLEKEIARAAGIQRNKGSAIDNTESCRVDQAEYAVVSELRWQLQDTRDRLRECLDELERIRGERQSRDDIHRSEDLIEQSEQQRNELTQKLKHVTRLYHDALQEVDDLKRAQNDNFEAGETRIFALEEALKESRDRAKQGASQLTDALRQMSTEVSTLRAQNESLQLELERQKVQDLRTTRASIAQRKLEEEVAYLREEVERRELQLQTQGEAVEASHRELNRLQSELKTSTNRQRVMEGELNSCRTELELVNNEIQWHRQQRNDSAMRMNAFRSASVGERRFNSPFESNRRIISSDHKTPTKLMGRQADNDHEQNGTSIARLNPQTRQYGERSVRTSDEVNPSFALLSTVENAARFGEPPIGHRRKHAVASESENYSEMAQKHRAEDGEVDSRERTKHNHIQECQRSNDSPMGSCVEVLKPRRIGGAQGPKLDEEIAVVERMLTNYNHEKDMLESELCKMPPHAGRNISERKRKVRLESRLAAIHHQISELRLFLRQHNVLGFQRDPAVSVLG